MIGIQHRKAAKTGQPDGGRERCGRSIEARHDEKVLVVGSPRCRRLPVDTEPVAADHSEYHGIAGDSLQNSQVGLVQVFLVKARAGRRRERIWLGSQTSREARQN